MEKNYFTTIGTTPKSKNLVLPLINGEETWWAIKASLLNAKESIHMTFWGFDSEMELLREPAQTFLNPDQRRVNKLMDILIKKHNEGVKIRLLLWDWMLPFGIGHPALDSTIYTYGHRQIFEVIYQPHPNNIGSWHQKSIIIDNSEAFVGGMNAKQNDWDTNSHTLYDYRRTPHSTSGNARKSMQTQKKIPDYPPRQDYMARLLGEVVTDVQSNFIERWNYCITQKYDWSQHLSPISYGRVAGFSNVKCQISRTLPVYPPSPTGEQGILETYRKAISLADKYIYIEDQYFRSTIMAREIAIACKKNKKLKVIVLTQPDYLSEIESEETWKIASPSTYWTNNSYQIVKSVVPDFSLFYLVVSDIDAIGKTIYKPINLHAKMMIIDDEWYTIGSCNFNDRGFQYEGELNVAVQHESAKDFRKKVFNINLGINNCPDDPSDAINLFYDHASKNFDAWGKKAKLISKVLPFSQTGPYKTPFPSDWQ
jgi:phospholipase D1/2